MRSRTPQPNEVYGHHLRALRRARRLTREALANRADVSVNIISRLERAIIISGRPRGQSFVLRFATAQTSQSLFTQGLQWITDAAPKIEALTPIIPP